MSNSSRAQASSCSSADANTPFRPLDNCRVLLVEDSPDHQRSCLKTLQRDGADVTLECSGRSAVDVALAIPAVFDVVVMDLRSPDADGLAATRELRQRGFNKPIIAMTACDDEAVKLAWLQAGVSEFLTKPVDSARLAATILQRTQARTATTA